MLILLVCLTGLYKAHTYKFFDLDSFDVNEYEHFEQVENGDLNWCQNGKVGFAFLHITFQQPLTTLVLFSSLLLQVLMRLRKRWKVIMHCLQMITCPTSKRTTVKKRQTETEIQRDRNSYAWWWFLAKILFCSHLILLFLFIFYVSIVTLVIRFNKKYYDSRMFTSKGALLAIHQQSCSGK